MTDAIDRLKTALSDRYTIERELGAGGMATVYLAQDLKLHRKVAVKVLRPDLAAALGPERFLQEIDIAAQLTHPHILALYDCGEADGFLYYVMPYVEGESLRDKLTREGELPIAEAVRILREVVDALAKAHSNNVVHRDIKPDNVMLSDRHALVMDFGVAKAVSEATGRNKMTTAGVALGTPAYMAPEQASADPHIDHRADIYAVGAMAYELLTGRPPFTGNTQQEILAAHVTQHAEPVTKYRDAVPAALAALVMKCLEKKAADRWQSADELLRELETIATPSGGVTPTQLQPTRAVAAESRGMARWALGGVGLALVVAVTWFGLARMGSGPETDENVVAVLPFRVVGAGAELSDLREGMVDLMATFLTGEGGTPRSADPGTVISAWRSRVDSEDEDLDEEGAIELAQSIGAGQVLTGAVVGSGPRFVLRGTLMRVNGRGEHIQASIEGPTDSLFAFLPRFVAQLLAQRAGLAIDQSTSINTTSLPALRAYLRGQAEYRRARFREAVNRYSEALEADADFALAGVGYLKAAGWAGGSARMGEIAERAAWENRDLLGVRDRAIVNAILGGNGPGRESLASRLSARQEAVTVAADRAEAWYLLGDTYFDDGALLGIDDPLGRAEQAFRRAIATDSSVAGVVQHLVLAAAWRGDTADVRRYQRLLEAALGDSAAPGTVAGHRWFAAIAIGDTAMRDAQLAVLETVEASDLAALNYNTMLLPFAGHRIHDFRDYMSRVERRLESQVARNRAARHVAYLAWDAGRPNEAATALGRRTVSSAALRVMAGLMWSGDSLDAARAYDELLADAVESDGCTIALWRLEHGELVDIESRVRSLRQSGDERDPDSPATRDEICADIVEASLAQRRGGSDAATLIERLDALLLTGPRRQIGWANLAVARMLEVEGEYARAAAAAARTNYFVGYTLFLATHFRESGRLWDLAGDRDAAIDAYSRYLDLRSDPEPAVEAEVEEVRQALARLTGEGRR